MMALPLERRGLGCHIRHERDCRGAINTHGDEQKRKRNDERRKGKRARLFCVSVIKQGQNIDKDHRKPRAKEDERHSAADTAVALVGQRSKER